MATLNPESNPSSPSILIVGAGIFGTSTAYHLSQSHPEPSRITLLDRTPFPPTHAASTDINKIVRADYTSRFYMDLAYEALEAWKTWPILKPYLHNSGWVALSEPGSDYAERIRRNLRERGSDVTSDIEINEDLRVKWGGVLSESRLEEMDKGYWNPEACWADAGNAVAKMTEESIARGVRYETGDVEEILLGQDGGGVKGVKTRDEKVYDADKVVLATGAWTSQLLSPVEDKLHVEEEDRIEKQITAAGVCVVHYKLEEEEYKRFRDMPVIIYSDKGDIQPPPQKTRLLKITNARSFSNYATTSSGTKLSVPPVASQNTVSEKLKQETLDSLVSQAMPSFAKREVDYWRLCWDAVTPSQDQLITKHPHSQLSNLYLAVGGSFHSWKFLPIIGTYVVNVLNGISNGTEKDGHWKWKSEKPEGRGAHEKVVPRRDLKDLDD